MSHTRRDQRGFTLVELVVVVLILGILVTIVIASYTSAQRLAMDAADRANLRILRGAVDRYVIQESRLPADIDELYPEYVNAKRPFSDPRTHIPYRYDPATGKVTNPSHPDR